MYVLCLHCANSFCLSFLLVVVKHENKVQLRIVRMCFQIHCQNMNSFVYECRPMNACVRARTFRVYVYLQHNGLQSSYRPRA